MRSKVMINFICSNFINQCKFDSLYLSIKSLHEPLIHNHQLMRMRKHQQIFFKSSQLTIQLCIFLRQKESFQVNFQTYQYNSSKSKLSQQCKTNFSQHCLLQLTLNRFFLVNEQLQRKIQSLQFPYLLKLSKNPIIIFKTLEIKKGDSRNMKFKNKTAIENFFTILTEIQRNRTSFQYLQQIVGLNDFLIIISLTFWSWIEQNQNKQYWAEVEISAIQLFSNIITSEPAFNLVLIVNFSSLAVILFLAIIQIILYSERCLDIFFSKYSYQVSQLIINKAAISVSWIYEITFVPFYIFLVGNNSILNTQGFQWIFIIINIAASFAYVFVFQKRKIFGQFLPVLFLIRTTLSAEAASVITIIACLYFWKAFRHKFEEIVYIQTLLLEISEFIRINYSLQLSLNHLFVLGLVVLILPVIKYLSITNLYFARHTIPTDLEILEIIRKLHNKSSLVVSINETIAIQTFFASFSQQILHLHQKEHKNTMSMLVSLLEQKLENQITEKSKDIEKLMIKIQLYCYHSKNPLKAYKLTEELNILTIGQSLRVRYNAYYLANQIMNKLSLNNSLNFQQIKQKDIFLQSHERQIPLFLKSVIKYWQYLQGQVVVQQKLFDKLQSIDLFEQKIKKHIQYCQHRSSMKNNQLILQFALKCFSPQYQMKTASVLPKEELKKEDSTNFLSIENDKISYMSYNLCKILGFDKDQVKGLNKCEVFPECASNIEEFALQNGEKQVFTIPLLDFQRFIVPLNGDIHIIPNFEGYLCYFIRFQENLYENNPYLIIDVIQQSVDFVSKNFFKYFTDLEKQQRINLDELFCFKFNYLKEANLWQSKFEMKMKKREKVMVKITKICTYKTQRSEYYLFKLDINPKIITSTTLNIFIGASTIESTENKAIKYQKEMFFCKISHAYENTYNEELKRLKDNSQWTAYSKLLIMFGLMVLTSLATFIFIKIEMNINRSVFLNQIQNIQSVNQARNNIFILYQKSFQLFYMRENNVSFTSIYAQNSSIIELYINELNQLINDLQLFGLTQHPQLQNLAFTMYFPHFILSAHTIGTNIIDIIQNCKQFLINNDIAFLVNNYHLVSIFDEAYDFFPIIEAEILQENQGITYCIICSLCINLVLLIFIYNTIRIGKQCRKQILIIIMSVNKNFTMKTISLLRYFLKFSIENQQLYLKESNQNMMKKFNGLIKQMKKQKTGDIQQKTTAINKEQNKIIAKFTEKQEQKQFINGYEHLLNDKKAIFSGFIITYLRQSYFVIIFFILCCYLIRSNNVILQSTQEKIDGLKYFHEYFESQLNIISISGQLYQNSVQRLYKYNSSAPQNTSIMIQFHYEMILPSYFDQFIQTQKRRINSNLCQQNIPPILFDVETCNSRLGGVLTNGLGITFGLYMELIQSINQRYSIIDPQMTNQDGLAKLSEILLMQSLMQAKIKESSRFYKDLLQEFSNLTVSRLILYEIYQQIFVLIVIIFIFGFGIKKFRKRYNLLVKGFSILPKDYILSCKLIKYLKKYDIFKKFVQM